jgi:hypothetical protein
MRKIILYICVLFAALPCLTSCILDKEKEYTFLYEVQANLKSEEDWEYLKEYFQGSFVGTKTYPIFATYADTYTQAVELYDQDIKTINEDIILDCIKDPDDAVYVCGVITGDKVRETIKYNFWNYEYKQMKRPDPEE